MKTYRSRLVCICAAAGINLIFSVLFILQLPDTVPIHFTIDWVCDNTGSRWNGILYALTPLITILPMSLVGWFDKKNQNVTSIISLFLLLYFIILDWLLLFSMDSGVKIGERLDVPFLWILMLLFSVSFFGIGNYLPVVGKNKLLGIRTPYTLQNDSCWKITHRFAGRLWVVSGLLWTIINFYGILTNASSIIAVCALFVFMTADILLPVFYSYIKRNV